MRIFSVENINMESITFMKVKIIMNQWKLSIVTKRNVKTRFSSVKNTNMQIICKFYSWILYLIMPKGTIFVGSGKLGLNSQTATQQVEAGSSRVVLPRRYAAIDIFISKFSNKKWTLLA